MSEILKFNIQDIDWLKCHLDACKSNIKESSDLWKNGIKNTLEISKILKIDRHTVILHLKQGAKLGLCDYDEVEESIKNLKNNQQKNCKQVKCLNTNEVFNSIKDASKKYNANDACISKCCNGKSKFAGKHPLTKEKLIWEFYYDEELSLGQSDF